MLTMKSKIKEVYSNPIGHDAIAQLLRQLGVGEGWITNPVIGNLRLRTLAFLSRFTVPQDFFDALLTLLNTDADDKSDAISRAGGNEMLATDEARTPQWWKEAVFYQIYPQSFKDSNGDGIGDLCGIIEKLDYLQSLGVNALWLSPIYDSPNDDNGYDIRDYRAIMKQFGTMNDFDELLTQVHARGMRLIMDLVVNHTSDEHRWFKEALANSASKYRDYYFFRPLDAKNSKPFNNWLSFFSGSAWNFYPEQGTQALHLFSKKQMDLNWDNPEVRSDITTMVNWWLDKGIDGFRMDVINYISKREGLPDGNDTIHDVMGYKGIEHYFYGPHLNEYLRELHEKAFAPHRAFSVGETPGIGMRTGELLTAQSRGELDMVFSFDQLETPGHTRFDDYSYDLNYLKKYFIEWQSDYSPECWMSLFYENHDNPRMVSKVNPDPSLRAPLAKLLATLQLTLKGTPFIFQGQELGSINQEFRSIADVRDIESINLFHELVDGGATESDAFATVLAGSRDHARVPMEWDETAANGGFTDAGVTPWIAPMHSESARKWSAAAQASQPDSVLNYYRELIELRGEHKEALVYGKVHFVHEKTKNYFAYYRVAQGEVFFVEANLSDGVLRAPKNPLAQDRFDGVVATYPVSSVDVIGERVLRPYETRIYRVSA